MAMDLHHRLQGLAPEGLANDEMAIAETPPPSDHGMKSLRR